MLSACFAYTMRLPDRAAEILFRLTGDTEKFKNVYLDFLAILAYRRMFLSIAAISRIFETPKCFSTKSSEIFPLFVLNDRPVNAIPSEHFSKG